MTEFALSASISYPYDEHVLALFEPELKSFPRATYSLEKRDDTILFSISAADATSLRACLTTITKVLSVWEATRDYGR